MARSSVTIRINNLLKERRKVDKESRILSKEELDVIQTQTFLNINRDYGSMGSEINDAHEPAGRLKK